MAVEFLLLGDVEVRSDGRRLDIGASRQRCVLVALLVDVNCPVPAAQLIERVWADDLPHRARNALAGYLSRLRQAIADEGVEIVREPTGYMLRSDPTTVDLHRFRTLSAQARTTADPAEADRLFDAALALWRGEPFPTLDTPWGNEVRNALQAERLAVMLDRNDAGLRAGRHGALLPEIDAMARDHPLDERLAGQLMLVQYRCGRQAAALETFREMRERLVEELGADPSPALQRVHQQILEGDPGWRAVEPPVRVPAMSLPRRATSFVGREEEIACVCMAVRGGAVVTLTGFGGVGKTRLALEAAARVKGRFGDGVWVCELAPLDDETAIGHAVAAALRLHQRHGLGIAETVIEYLRTRELLLIVDNCEHLLDGAARLVDRIVGHCPRVCVLATSREPLGISGEQLVPVAPLPLQDAIGMFVDRARAVRPDFEPEQQPAGAVAEICRRLDGLPLGIELAAARMRMMSALDVARRLDRLRLLSGGVRGAPSRQKSLIATIEWSYQLLAEPEQSLFVRLSVFAGGFDLEAAHGICGDEDTCEDDTLELLAGLVDKSMAVVLSDHATSRYGLLETVRAYGRERLAANGIDDVIADRHAAYFTDLAERAAAGLHGVDERGWVERLLPDYDNLRTAFERLIAVADIDRALRLVGSLGELVHLRLGYESATWAERTLQFADPGHPLFPAVVGFVARAAWNRGDYARAQMLARGAADRMPSRGTARVAYPADVLADVALSAGDPDTALRHYEAETLRARREDDPIRLVCGLYYVAVCHAVLRMPEAGLSAAEECLRVSDETANPTARSMARYALGLVLKKSEPQRAQALFDEAAQVASSIGNFWWHGVALMEAAATRSVHGDAAVAARDFIDVLDHWERVGDWTQLFLTLRYVTRLLVRLGAEDDALALHRTLVTAGKSSPLSETQVAELGGAPASGPTGAEAVARARDALKRYC